MDSVILAMTWLGSSYLLLPLAACLSFLLVWAGRSAQAMLLSLSLVLTMLCVHVMKLMVRRPRPVATTELLVPMPPDWSFPSGHTAQATAFFLALALIAIRLLPPFWASLVAFCSLLIIGVVGYSRVYLQVHFVSDVLAGMVLAILVVWAVQLASPFLPWQSGK